MSNIASTNENAVIGGRLATLREQFRLSQKEFAAKLGVSLRAYQNYERGEREIPASLIRALYDTFKVQPVWLLLGGADPIQNRGEIDPTLAEAIAQDLDNEIVGFSPSLNGYHLALIYNRVIKRVAPGEYFGDVLLEEVRFLRDLLRHENPPKPHPEELRHLESLGVPDQEVYGKDTSRMNLQREISVTAGGKKFIGSYKITGAKRLGITVYYQGKSHTDAHIYRPEQCVLMEGIAHHLLWELVTGNVIANTTPEMRRSAKKRSTPRR